MVRFCTKLKRKMILKDKSDWIELVERWWQRLFCYLFFLKLFRSVIILIKSRRNSKVENVSLLSKKVPFTFTTFEMADNEEEEPNPQPHHVRNYYGESDTFNGVRLNAKRRKETSSCWPNQKCLSGIIMQRIIYSLGKQDLKLSDFVEFGFQVNINCKLFDFWFWSKLLLLN